MKTTYTFTAPDGSKLKRKTERTYTHAILSNHEGKWKLESCIGRPDLVADRLEAFGKGSPDVIAVEVDHINNR